MTRRQLPGQQALGLVAPTPGRTVQVRCRECRTVQTLTDPTPTVDPRWVTATCGSCRTRHAILDVIARTEGASHVQPS